jgi:putative thioredoxin
MNLGNPTSAKAPPTAAGADIIKDTTTAGFARDVIEASRTALVLVDFWAAWCGPCKQLTPMLEKVVRGYGGKVRLVKLNIDEHPSIAGQLRVQNLPTVYAFRDGRPVDGFMGVQPESQLKAFIDRHVGDAPGEDLAEALKAADEALQAGDVQNAAEVYAAVLQEDPKNVQALSGLARAYLATGDIERAEQTFLMIPVDKQSSGPAAGVRAAIDLAKVAGKSIDVGALLAQVQAAPTDHQARLDLALAYAAGGDKDNALDHLLELFRRDRKWNEEAARKQLVTLFEAWGPKDAATIEGRRRLSSLMFS